MIRKTISIGSLCEGFIFSSIFKTRVLGPVDNIHGWNFKSVLDVFNGNLFDAILNDKIVYKEENIYVQHYDDDNQFRYYCSNIGEQWNWRTVHTNFEREDRKKLLKKRIKTFNNFNKTLKDDYAYIYAISDGDNNLTEDEFNFVLNTLPSNVVDKLIIVSGVRFEIPKLFYQNLRCIHYNYDLTNFDCKIHKIWDKIISW